MQSKLVQTQSRSYEFYVRSSCLLGVQGLNLCKDTKAQTQGRSAGLLRPHLLSIFVGRR